MEFRFVDLFCGGGGAWHCCCPILFFDFIGRKLPELVVSEYEL